MQVEKGNNYLSKKFQILKSGHLITDCLVNGVSAKVIIDTGASNSCIDSNSSWILYLGCGYSFLHLFVNTSLHNGSIC